MSFRFVLVSLLCLATLTAGCGGLGSRELEDDGEYVADPVNGYPTEPARIVIDESGTDWDDTTVLQVDGQDDGAAVDFERLRVAHSSQYLFLQLEVSDPMNLQEGNELTLHLDTDNDPATGQRTMGVGAEISWTFGERSGEVYTAAGSQKIDHADLGLTSLPTVRSEAFEVALDRSAQLGPSVSLLDSDSVRIALSASGDRLPDEDGGVGYILSETDVAGGGAQLGSPQGGALRLLSYNVRRDTLFDDAIQPHYRRVLQAVEPDVIGFQEVYEHTAAQTGRTVSQLYDDASGWEWAKAGTDLVVGSRYPILETHAISGYEDYKSAATLLDADGAVGSDLLYINMHPPCCNAGPEDGEPSSNVQRQRVVDGVAAFIRDVKHGEGPFAVASETPIVIAGDMNFVGNAQQPRTLRTGEIVDTNRYGSSVSPDWDGSALLDTNPGQTGAPLHTTWIDAESSFPPGRLDYAFVSDSVLEVVHEFVLHTPSLSDSTLNAHGLRPGDTKQASDHLPVVVDVTPR